MKLNYLGFAILIIILGGLYFYVNPSNVNFFPKCPLFATTGIYCPGCGSQRATHSLLNLDIYGVFKQNLLYGLSLILFFYHIIILSINKFSSSSKNNILYHPTTPKLILVIVISFWILRNIPYYPFNLLAPK